MTGPGRISRRRFLTTLAASGAVPVLGPAEAIAQDLGVDAAFYGITANSDTDQSAALQRAIDETRFSGTPLLLPPGRYLASGLALGNGSRIVGVPGASRLVLSGSDPLVTARGADTVSLRGLVFDGLARDMGDADGLVRLDDVARIDLRDCAIENSWSNGIALNRCGGRVSGCRIVNARAGALFSLDGRDLDISDNQVSDCGDNGIMVWQSAEQHDGARISGNHVARIHNRSGGNGPYGNGILVFRGGGVSVSGNRISDCSYSAVRVNAGTNVMVTGNQCADIGDVALYVEFGFNGAVVAGNIVDNALEGISVTNLNDNGHLATVSGNLIRNLRIGSPTDRRGSGIHAAGDTAVTGNVVENAAHTGFALGYGPYLRNVVAANNIVRNAPYGFKVSVVEGIRNTVIADNVMSGITEAAIVGMRWDEFATGDLAVRGADAYPELTISGNRVG